MKFIAYYVKTGLQNYKKPTIEFWEDLTANVFPNNKMSYVDYVKQSRRVYEEALLHGYSFKLLSKIIDPDDDIDTIKHNILKGNDFIIFVNDLKDELNLYNSKNMMNAKIHDLKIDFNIKYNVLEKHVEYLRENIESLIHYSEYLGESLDFLIGNNNLSFKDKKIKEKEPLYKNIISPILKINVLNHNSRNYTHEIVSNIISQFNKKKEEFGVFYGELGYPSSFDVTLSNVSHNVIALYINSGILYGVIDILDTDKGEALVEMLKYGDYILAPRSMGKEPLDNDIKISSFDIIKKSESSYYDILEGSIKI